VRPSGDQRALESCVPEVSGRAAPPAGGDDPQRGFVVIVLGVHGDERVDDLRAIRRDLGRGDPAEGVQIGFGNGAFGGGGEMEGGLKGSQDADFCMHMLH
jgi:hypothetical protein